LFSKQPLTEKDVEFKHLFVMLTGTFEKYMHNVLSLEDVILEFHNAVFNDDFTFVNLIDHDSQTRQIKRDMHADLIMLFLMCLVGLSCSALLIWGFSTQETMPVQHITLVTPNFNPRQDLIDKLLASQSQ